MSQLRQIQAGASEGVVLLHRMNYESEKDMEMITTESECTVTNAKQ